MTLEEMEQWIARQQWALDAGYINFKKPPFMPMFSFRFVRDPLEPPVVPPPVLPRRRPRTFRGKGTTVMRADPENQHWTTAEVAIKTGVAASTLCHWVKDGVVSPSRSTDNPKQFAFLWTDGDVQKVRNFKTSCVYDDYKERWKYPDPWPPLSNDERKRYRLTYEHVRSQKPEQIIRDEFDLMVRDQPELTPFSQLHLFTGTCIGWGTKPEAEWSDWWIE